MLATMSNQRDNKAIYYSPKFISYGNISNVTKQGAGMTSDDNPKTGSMS
jgi:hypothetical protein